MARTHSPRTGRRPVGRGRAIICTILAVLGTTGCLKQIILEGQISSTRTASAAVNTIQDYEVAEKAAMAGIAQIEGMRYLAPDNEDALFMLTRAWTSVSLGFMEDEMERAEDNEGTGANWDYHKRRAESGYDRAVWYGIQLLEKKAPGFKQSTRNIESMKAYLLAFEDPEDAETLFWVGNAWLGRANVSKEKSELVGEIFVGVTMIERSVELDPNYQFGTGYAILGSYHARTPMAELDEAKELFDKSMKLSEGRRTCRRSSSRSATSATSRTRRATRRRCRKCWPPATGTRTRGSPT